MKKLSVCFVLCSMLWTATCSAAKVDTIEVKSEVSSVNVFFQGARVNRTATLHLSEGKHVLSVSGLPPTINPKLVKVKSPNRLKILALSHKVSKTTQRPTRSEVKHLEDERTTLEEDIEWLKAKREVYDEEEALLVQNTELKKADGETHTLGVRQAADFYRERLTEIAKIKFDITLGIREAQKEIREVNSEINSLLAGTQVSQMELLLLVEASGVISGELNVDYFTNAAGWEPLYDFRFEAVNKPLELVYNANVYQSTGEDWNEVDLSLTEGLPKQKTSLPEFDRWYITRRPSTKTSTIGSQQKGIGTLRGTLTDSETGEPLPFVNVVLQQAGEQVHGTVTDFDGRYTIKPIPSGQYEVYVSSVGYTAKRINGVRINLDKITFLDVGLEQGVQLEAYEAIEYQTPIIDKDGGTSGRTISRENITNMPDRNLSDNIQRLPQNSSIRGSREDHSFYYIDGVKVRGSNASNAQIFIDETTAISSPKLVYTVDYKYSVPSDGVDRLLTIKSEKVSVEFLYRAMPKVDTDIHLMARINNWGNLQLLSGKSTIYFQGAYSGESMLDAESVKDTLEIALGADENILLERRLDKELSTDQTFGNKVKKELHWEIEVRSNKSHPIMLELVDQLPLSDNEDVSVQAIDLADAKQEKDSGKLTWELRLEPNSSKKVSYSYELKYPETVLVYN